MHITRYLESQILQTFESSLYPAIMIYGARQVGKTTLLHKLMEKIHSNTKFLPCDDPSVKDLFDTISIERLKRVVGNYELIILDEAQKIPNIGTILKLMIDYIPGIKIFVSGSSSFELANQLSEPLTGRKITYRMYPISLSELYKPDQIVQLKSNLDFYLRFGLYPKTFQYSHDQSLENYLIELTGDYLYKDILEFRQIRNSEQLRRLLTALALQIGQEVSYTELGNIVGIDQKTVVRYIDLLEKSYILFILPAFSRNQRNEINKSRKIYFYDLGIRNALIRNFNELKYRNDTGHLWENFLLIERMKRDSALGIQKNYYFWRTYEKQEIDLIEEYGGKLQGFEFKLYKGKVKAKSFLETYPNSSVKVINQENFEEFVLE
ncbi:MAG: ATP-binding protein [Caldisericia bacterium]|nr:ATP-binding protein [Caldisericia bacterium]